jgi:hypothetical protein
MNEIKPCMGGWCQKRDACLHHTDPTNRHRPAERLCEPGEERDMYFKTCDGRVSTNSITPGIADTWDA